MERLLFQLIKKKLATPDKFPLLNYHKTLNSLPLCLPPSPLKLPKKFPPLTCPGERGGRCGLERKLYDLGRTVKIFIFALLFRASKSFMKAFINSFEAPQRSMKKNISS